MLRFCKLFERQQLPVHWFYITTGQSLFFILKSEDSKFVGKLLIKSVSFFCAV